jgi:hypothetical protein
MSYILSQYFQTQLYGLDSNLPKNNEFTDATADSLDEAERRQYLFIGRAVTARIEKVLGFSFVPKDETRKADANHNSNIINNGQTLLLPRWPLLQLDGVTLGNSTALTVGTQVRGSPTWETPMQRLDILDNAGSFYQYTTNWNDAIEVDGIWGWRSDFSNSGFVDSGDTITDAGGINTTDTTITVADADGLDDFGYLPRFDVGQVLKIESEYLIITKIAYTTNTLTVLRGQLGTTAAAHIQTTPINIWYVEPDIVEAVALAISYEIFRRGQFAQVISGSLNSTIFPPDWPERALHILEEYRSPIIRSV